MNDTDYIREAVRLADGFYLAEYMGREVARLSGPQQSLRMKFDALVPWYVDALAAQLVRQVDALDDPNTVETAYGKVWVGYRSRYNETWKLTRGKDRTMTIIRAIVDSGVLGGALEVR